ncbi:MAG: formylglycine-generating enzyme family protein, partial [Treponema sp.]|nr:formylglycine-generating enzyme family protein [Treponema sp.]
LAQVGSSGGTITIHTPEGDLNLAASATTITTSAADTTVTISATDASGSAITSGLTWNGVTVYYGTDEIATGSGNSYMFAKTFPKGTYRLTVSVVYKGTTYSDSFTIKKTVDGYVAQPNVFDGEATLCADDADRKSSVFIKDRPITISATLWACDHETTQGEYETYCFYGSSSPSSYSYGVGANYPVYFVNWYDAIVYCNLRSIAEGKTACYKLGSESNPKNWTGVVAGTGANAGKYCGPSSNNSDWNGITCDFEANGYRLPTEAEWEYLARGGNLTDDGQTLYSGSDTIGNIAWHTGNASMAHEVCKKAANGKGLYDMSGNVWEWCWDWNSTISATTPATGAAFGSTRVNRGGSWSGDASTSLVSLRNNNNANSREVTIGFRVVRNAP